SSRRRGSACGAGVPCAGAGAPARLPVLAVSARTRMRRPTRAALRALTAAGSPLRRPRSRAKRRCRCVARRRRGRRDGVPPRRPPQPPHAPAAAGGRCSFEACVRRGPGAAAAPRPATPPRSSGAPDDVVLILGIESSCDDSAAAVLDGGTLRSSLVSSQDAVHGPYGGVVPELASRHHVRNMLPVIDAALSRAAVDLDAVDGIAVTCGPGLIGSLPLGLSVAKGIAQARR